VCDEVQDGSRTAIMCATGLIAPVLLVTGLNVTHANGKALVWIIGLPVMVTCGALGTRLQPHPVR
jgi:hypothetical protein